MSGLLRQLQSRPVHKLRVDRLSLRLTCAGDKLSSDRSLEQLTPKLHVATIGDDLAQKHSTFSFGINSRRSSPAGSIAADWGPRIVEAENRCTRL